MARSVGVWVRKTVRRLRPPQPPTLVNIPDQTAGPGRDQKIPRVVYQTAESRLVHPTHAKSIHEFRALNPNLAFHIYDKDRRDTYMAQHWAHHDIYDIYQRAVFGQMKADIFRCCIIYDNGGYYIDYNKGATTPLTHLHPQEAEAWLSMTTDVASICPPRELLHRDPETMNFFAHEQFGFSVGHPALLAVIDGIVRNSDFFAGKKCWSAHRAVHTLTGGGVLTEAIRPLLEPKSARSWHYLSADEGSLLPTLWIDSEYSRLRQASSAQDVMILNTRAGGGASAQPHLAMPPTVTSNPRRNVKKGRAPSLRAPKTATLQDQASDTPFVGAIPARLVQTSPSRRLLKSHFDQIQRFRSINPDLDHVVFDEEAVNNYMANAWGSHPIFDVFARCEFGPMKADIFRYCQIYDQGGFYLDITKAVWARLSGFASNKSEAVISFDKNECGQMAEAGIANRLLYPENHVSQWCFGFSPKHQILDSAIARIVELAPFFEQRAFRSVRQAVFAFTGPGVFTWAVREFFKNFDTERIAQVERFFGEPGFLERLDTDNFAFPGAKHYASQNNVHILTARMSN